MEKYLNFIEFFPDAIQFMIFSFIAFILEAKKIYLVFWYNSGSVVYFFVCFKCVEKQQICFKN